MSQCATLLTYGSVLLPHLCTATSKTCSESEIGNTVNCSEPGCLRLGSLEAKPEVGILVNVIFLRERAEGQSKKTELVCGLS